MLNYRPRPIWSGPTGKMETGIAKAFPPKQQSCYDELLGRPAVYKRHRPEEAQQVTAPGMQSTKLLLCLLPFLASNALAAIYTDPSQLPHKTYDFVVIGGRFSSFVPRLFTDDELAGTAGNVIANRLSENPKFKILVIEAGR